MKKNMFRIITIVALIIAILALSVAYAAVSQQLLINGTTKLAGNTWDVHFINLEDPTIVGQATETTKAALSYTTLTFDINLTAKDDAITYIWAVKNFGSIDAKLAATPVLDGLTEANSNNVNYEFTYEDGTTISVGDILTTNSSKKLKLKIYLTDSVNTNTVLSLRTTLTYVQK